MTLGWGIITTGMHADLKVAPALNAAPEAELVAPHQARGLHGLVELAGLAVERELVRVGVAALGAEELGVGGAGEDEGAVGLEAEDERAAFVVEGAEALVLGDGAPQAGPGLAVVDELACGGEVGGSLTMKNAK